MKPLSVRLIPVILMVGIVMVVFIQHQGILVEWRWFGQTATQVSLGLLLLLAYGAGLLAGFLWEGLWALRDYLRERKTQRQLQKLEDRIRLLEQERPKLVPINWRDPYEDSP
jgi:uncharacterized membrane protein YciS (DUF1049 family)